MTPLDTYRLGLDLLALVALSRARKQRVALFWSFATESGPDGEFWVYCVHGPGKGQTRPYTGRTVEEVVRVAREGEER